MSNLEKVQEFHLAFQQSISSNVEPTKENKLLRLRLAFEELCELAEALGVTDSFYSIIHEISEESLSQEDTDVINKVEVLDALCDIEYINNGTIVAFGLEKVYSEAFTEVHQSNMSKLCVSIEEALETKENYKKQGISTIVEPMTNGYFAVKRESDNKVLKSINYKPFEGSKYL